MVTLSSNCGTKFEDGVGVLKLGKVESTSWGWFKKPQLATSTLTSTSKIGSWGHEVEALSYWSWRSSWDQVGGLWTTLIHTKGSFADVCSTIQCYDTMAHYRSYRACYGLLWPKIKVCWCGPVMLSSLTSESMLRYWPHTCRPTLLNMASSSE